MHSLVFCALLPLLGGATLLTSPNPNSRHILRRQSSCPIGETVCGQYCISIGYICCPDQQGGCKVSEYCTTGDDGTPCCCPLGKICDGSCAVSVSSVTGAASSATGVATTPTAPAASSAPTSSISISPASCASVGKLPCGTGCMWSGDTCCPDGSGSCSAGEVCWLDTNGNYGCCPAGETCTGSVSSSTFGLSLSFTMSNILPTSSSTVPGLPTPSQSFSLTTPAAVATTSTINGGFKGEATSWSAVRNCITNLL